MNFRYRNIVPTKTLLEAFKLMDSLDKKLLIVIEDNKYLGLLSSGDIQRAIINNNSLDTPIFNVLRKNVRVATPNDSFDSIKQMMLEHRMELCPVVNTQNQIIEIHFWEDLFKDYKPQPISTFNVPVVIMAGGFGIRLKPLTNVLPKPLIPIGEKTLIEEIFDRFSFYGCNTFYISVNYKADLIEYYIQNQKLPYKLHFFKERVPLGTAGSLSLLKGFLHETFFVSNCDILIEQDYSEILNYHAENHNEITLVAALKHYPIPYGIVKTGEYGQLKNLEEKPVLTFKINSGMYVLEPHLLEEIPENSVFHITTLIENVKSRGGKVGVFPVSEKSWVDIGSWAALAEKYRKFI